MSVDAVRLQREATPNTISAMFVEAAGKFEQSLPHIGHGEQRIVPCHECVPSSFLAINFLPFILLLSHQ